MQLYSTEKKVSQVLLQGHTGAFDTIKVEGGGRHIVIIINTLRDQDLLALTQPGSSSS